MSAISGLHGNDVGFGLMGRTNKSAYFLNSPPTSPFSIAYLENELKTKTQHSYDNNNNNTKNIISKIKYTGNLRGEKSNGCLLSEGNVEQKNKDILDNYKTLLGRDDAIWSVGDNDFGWGKDSSQGSSEEDNNNGSSVGYSDSKDSKDEAEIFPKTSKKSNLVPFTYSNGRSIWTTGEKDAEEELVKKVIDCTIALTEDSDIDQKQKKRSASLKQSVEELKASKYHTGIWNEARVLSALQSSCNVRSWESEISNVRSWDSEVNVLSDEDAIPPPPLPIDPRLKIIEVQNKTVNKRQPLDTSAFRQPYHEGQSSILSYSPSKPTHHTTSSYVATNNPKMALPVNSREYNIRPPNPIGAFEHPKDLGQNIRERHSQIKVLECKSEESSKKSANFCKTLEQTHHSKEEKKDPIDSNELVSPKKTIEVKKTDVVLCDLDESEKGLDAEKAKLLLSYCFSELGPQDGRRFPICEGGRCSHKSFWTRLRAKRGFSYFKCHQCGVEWRVPGKAEKEKRLRKIQESMKLQENESL